MHGLNEISIEEYKYLLESLESSTRSIETQLHSLETQHQHVDKYVAQNGVSVPVSNRTVTDDRQKQNLEIQHLKLFNKELKQKIRLQLLAQLDKTQRAIKGSLISFNEVLREDDCKFTTLNHEISRVRSYHIDSLALQVERTNLLLEVLKTTTHQTLRLRLDRIYQESLLSDVEAQSLNPDCELHLKTVQDDLNLLHAEIQDVAQMLISHEYEDHLHKIWAKCEEANLSAAVNGEGVIQRKLEAIDGALAELSEYYESLSSHQIIATALQDMLFSMEKPHTQSIATRTNSNVPAQTATEAFRKHLGIAAEYEASVSSEEPQASRFQLMIEPRQAILNSKASLETIYTSQDPELLGDCADSLADLDQRIDSSKQNVENMSHLADETLRVVADL